MSTNDAPPPTTGQVLAVLPLAVAFIILFSQPFEGAMVRMRSHFAPKSISLDGEETRTNPELRGLFATLQRTMALEGWWGVYKGAYVTAITLLTFMLPNMLFTVLKRNDGAVPDAAISILRLPTKSFVQKTGAPLDPSTTLLITLAASALVLFIGIPFTIIANRAIVTPYQLPFSVRGSLRLLLSRRERNRPYVLYCTPGLVVATLLTYILPGAVFLLDNYHIVPRDGSLRAALFVGLYVLSTAWIVPLKVIICKVSVQANVLPAAPQDGNELLLAESAEDFEQDTAYAVRCSSSDEDVVSIRPAVPKYTSLVDAYRTIVAEEGWQTLYRGWIWTALGLFLGSIGQIPDYVPRK